jgi:hypothetical protein
LFFIDARDVSDHVQGLLWTTVGGDDNFLT